MKRAVLLVLFVLFAVGCKPECDVCEKSGDSLVKNGATAPEFVITSTDGVVTFSTEQARSQGRRVLIYFLWSECSDCHAATPNVVELAQSIGGLNIDLVCIARGGGDATQLKAETYWQKVAQSVAPQTMPPLYYDSERNVYSKYARSGVPRFYIIVPTGAVVWQSTKNHTAAELMAALNSTN